MKASYAAKTVGIGAAILWLGLSCGIGACAMATWTERTPAGAVDLNWNVVASDATGVSLLAGVFGGRLYTSPDSGASWVERTPGGAADLSWSAGASDSDGSNLIVGVFGGRLYTSGDGGASWTERQPAGNFNKTWFCVASDADGSNLIAGVGGGTAGRLYTSGDSGLTWVERQPAGNVNRNWAAVGSDADGSNLIAGIASGVTGRLYTSSDGGLTWVERTPAGAVVKYWGSAASDATGLSLVAGIETVAGRLYTSPDGGVNWVERTPAGAVLRQWAVAASDADGSHLIAGVGMLNPGDPNGLYTSSNGGAAWAEEFPGGIAARNWQCAALDADGSHLIAAVYDGGLGGGRLYTGTSAAGGIGGGGGFGSGGASLHLHRKPYDRCANVWDWCLENDKRLWTGIEWKRHGCIPVKCWRLEDGSLHSIPEQGREFHKYGSIPLPAVSGVDVQILRFLVPSRLDGIVYSLLCRYTGPGFVEGGGDLLWRFRVGERWVRTMRAISTELGDYAAYLQLDEFFRVYSGQTIRAYGWVSPLSGLMGGTMIAALQGWYFPSQFAR